MKNPKAVFFDAGHTLLRAHPSIGAIYSAETRAFGPEVPGETFEQTFREVFKDFGPKYAANQKNASDEQDMTMWREVTRRVYSLIPEMSSVEYEPWFMKLYHKFSEPDVWRFYDDTIPTLKALRKRGLKLGVISNWDSRLRRITVEMGLTDLVDFVLISAEVGVRKPQDGIFKEALDLADVRPDEAMHVGDLFEEDIVGAHRSGIFPVYLDRGGRGLPETDIDMWVVKDLDGLIDRLD